jgi:hypothetical protein
LVAEDAAVEALRAGGAQGGDDRLDLLVDVLVRRARRGLLHRRLAGSGLARAEAPAALGTARALEARLRTAPSM